MDTATVVDPVRQHPVHAALVVIEAELARVRAGLLGVPDAEAATVAIGMARLQAVTRGTYLAALSQAADRDDSTAGRDAVATVVGALPMSTGRVRADLHEARTLAPTGTLPGLGAALASGRTTAEHSGIGVRALTHLPVRTVRERAEDIDNNFTTNAQTFPPPLFRRLADHVLATLHPERADRFDPESHLRREAHLAVDSTGMGQLRAQLDPIATAQLRTVLDALSAPATTGGDGQRVQDQRTAPQRRADAIGEMARLAAGGMRGEHGYGEGPRIVVHASVDQMNDAAGCAVAHDPSAAATTPGHVPIALRGPAHPAGAASCEQTGPLTPAGLARMACDATIERVILTATGRVLAMSTLGRSFTPAQRRALAARDGGCAFPGCAAPPSWTDSHHIRFWSLGGPTTVDNGVLLCQHHHTTIHQCRWHIEVHHGLPWFIPPPEHDPLQQPLRNTFHDAMRAAAALGQVG
ncbi:MAG: DUF222 domain-containing protein [Mycobacteriaceae bacterium]